MSFPKESQNVAAPETVHALSGTYKFKRKEQTLRVSVELEYCRKSALGRDEARHELRGTNGNPR